MLPAFGRQWYQGAPSGTSTRLRYAATGVLDSILASGISLKQGYAASTGQLTSVAVTGSNAFPARTYTYDALGRMSSRQWGGWDSSEARFLAYDNAGRLKAWRDTSARNYYELVCTATDPDPMAINSCLSWSYVLNNPHAYVRGDTTIAYDAVGNRTDGSGTQVDQGNRLSGWRGYAITFDSAGNVTTRNKANDNLSLYWNALGQLDSARRNGVVTTFKYDAFGRRVQKVSGGTTTNFLLDDDVTLAELDGSWAAQRVYSYWPGTDRPHSVKVGSSKYTYLYEEPGNVVALATSSGTLVNTYQYDPWGADVGTTSAVTQPFRYTGRELDSETGLYYYRARYYDPGMGRFLSEDPIGLAGGINAYAYVDNDPADQSDPFGLKGDFHCPFGQRVVANSDGTPGCEPGTGFPARLDEVRVWGYYGFDWQRDHGQRTIGARDPWGDPVRREADPGLWERMQADPSCRSAVTQAALSMVVDAFGVKEVLVAARMTAVAAKGAWKLALEAGGHVRMWPNQIANAERAMQGGASLAYEILGQRALGGATEAGSGKTSAFHLSDAISFVPIVGSIKLLWDAKAACGY